LATNANGNFSGKPLSLINQALKLDPNNLMALWLSGTAAFNSGNYRSAVQTWEKLAAQLPPNSEDLTAIEGSIAEARSKGGLSTKAPVVPAKKGISGQIELSNDLKSKINAGDTVLVIARQVGERMPVAVLKTSVAQFPMRFALNDALAMNPGAPLSQLKEVTVEVRISKTGMAKPEPGDLISAVQTIQVGTENARLLVDQVRQ
jgi:cytochrome c-type biogenesis protein CcmH